MSAWQPIETLDRSTDQYVLLYENGAIRMLYWEAGGKCWTYPDSPFDVYNGILREPSHWMPLPAPPDQPAGDE